MLKQDRSFMEIRNVSYEDGRQNKAEASIIEVLEIEKRVFGVEHPSTLTSMGNLATIYQHQGRLREAEELQLQLQLIETRKRVLSEEHLNTLMSMANLALIYQNQGHWKKAEDLEVVVMETSSRVLGQEHPNTLTSINNLALIYQMSQ